MYTSTSSNDFLAYSRVARLAHSANSTLLGTFEHADKSGGAASFDIQRSTDDGASWSTLSTLSDLLTGSGHPSSQMWQPFLFELPQALGAYPAGTLPEVITHGRDNKIRNSDTIAPGNDPFPPRDKK